MEMLVGMVKQEEQTGPPYVLGRFEGAWAVLEAATGDTFKVPKAWLPGPAEEGDVLGLSLESGDDESSLRFAVDPVATDARRRRAEALREELPPGPEDDLEL